MGDFKMIDINNLTYANMDDINYAIKNKTIGSLYTLSINKNNVYANFLCR